MQEFMKPQTSHLTVEQIEIMSFRARFLTTFGVSKMSLYARKTR